LKKKVTFEVEQEAKSAAIAMAAGSAKIDRFTVPLLLSPLMLLILSMVSTEKQHDHCLSRHFRGVFGRDPAKERIARAGSECGLRILQSTWNCKRDEDVLPVKAPEKSPPSGISTPLVPPAENLLDQKNA
jgi:hypothetical protein